MSEEQEQPEERDEPEAATLSAADAMSLISPPGAQDEGAAEAEEGDPPTT